MFRLFRRFWNRLFRRPVSAPAPALTGSNDRNLDAQSPDTPIPKIQLPNRKPPKETPMPDELSAAPTRLSRVKMLSQVINVLRAYLATFGRPEAEVDFRAVIGAIAANLPAVDIENERLEGFIDEAIAAYGSVGNDNSIVDTTTQLLAEQVAVWLREQEVTVQNVMSAYLQQFAPDEGSGDGSGEGQNNGQWTTANILMLVQTVVATLNDGSLSRSGGRSLVAKVVETFDLDQALRKRIAPEWIALAQRVASYVRTGNLQAEVRSVAWSYLRQFQSILSPQLIEQIMAEGPLNLSPAEVLSGDLGEFSKMLYYKFQLLEADPVVTKSHADIAVQVRAAVEDFKRRRGDGLDVSEGIQTGDLEVSSPFVRTS
ncbi:MAG: hypothetical protein AB8B99_23675 [Phormidesmis sp.]